MSNLFSESELKIFPDLIANLSSKGFNLRPLQRQDFGKGFLVTLGELSKIGSISEQEFNSIFTALQNTSSTFILVIEDVGLEKIVACGTLFIEQKFLHQGGKTDIGQSIFNILRQYLLANIKLFS